MDITTRDNMDDLKRGELQCFNYSEYRPYPMVFPMTYHTHVTGYRTCMQRFGYVGRPGKMNLLAY